MVKRTWQDLFSMFLNSRSGRNRNRYEVAIRQEAFDPIRDLPLIETQSAHLLRVLDAGTVSTNVFLRRLHNFALGMNWIPWPVLPKKQWPAVHFREKRAVTRAEHEAICARESNPERRAFYQMCWHLGGAQSDVASLKAEDVNWDDRVIAFFRAKTKGVQIVHFGKEVELLLRELPAAGPLFPTLARMDEKHRASLFQCICRRLKISGLSLHSYRYAWAERAKVAGYPERFAQLALGHNSKAVHRAYAKKAQVALPALEDFERIRSSSTPPSAVPTTTTLEEGIARSSRM